MKTLILLATIILYQITFAQEKKEDDFTDIVGNRVNISNLGITVNVIDKWDVMSTNKSENIEIVCKDKDALIRICRYNGSTDSIFTLPNPILKDGKDISLKELIDDVIMFSLIEPEKKSSANLKLSSTISKIENGYELITMYKQINDQVFLINAKIAEQCLICKKEVESIVISIRLIE